MEEILAEEGRREMIECNRGRMGLMQKQKIFFALGTVNTITVFEDGCDRVLSMAAMRVRELHQKLSIFDQSSEIGKINQFAGEKPVAVSDDTFRLIQNACIYSKITNGYFDITTKPLNTIWKEAFKTGELPSDEIVQNTKWLTDYHDIVLNEQEKTVMLKKRGQQLDLGGIAKGYAADEVETARHKKGGLKGHHSQLIDEDDKFEKDDSDLKKYFQNEITEKGTESKTEESIENGVENGIENSTTGKFADGVYTGSGTGFRGTTKVQIVVENGAITDITVTSYADDHKFFSKAENGIISRILSTQSTDIDGFTASKKIREKKDIPILMLSARGSEYDKLFGFESGVDDYVTKPFSPKELMARIHVITRRHVKVAPQNEGKISVGGIVIDSLGHEVIIDGEKVELTAKEYGILMYLMQNKGIVLSRDQILNEVWGYDYYGDDRTVDWQMKLLRGKLGKYRDNIHTIRGVGYKFETWI